MKECRHVSYLLVLGATALLLASAPGASGQTITMEPVKEVSAADATSEVMSPTPNVKAPGASGQTIAMEPVKEDSAADATSEVVSPTPDVKAPGASGQNIVMEPVKEDSAVDATSEVVSPTPDVKAPGASGQNIAMEPVKEDSAADATSEVVSPTPDVKSEQAEENKADDASVGTTENPDVESANSTARQQGKFMFLFANKSTMTKFVLSVFSSATPYTCAKLKALTACTGRRKRFFRANIRKPIKELTESDPTSIDSSMDTPTSGRFERSGFLTVWTTSFSTKTVTSYYSNTRVTVSVSQACTVPGVIFAQCG